MLALVGDRHRGDQEVELLGVQGRDDAVPVGGHDGALDFHLGAQGVADLFVEADDIATGIFVVERRVGRFDAHLQGFGHGTGAERQGDGGSQEDLFVVLHVGSSVSGCWT
ncbi:hypothetical protein D3C76_1550780 [compost metagenome]